MAYPLNWNAEIRQCGDALKGLGLFASQRLSKGLKVLSEAPLLVYEARDDLVADIQHQFPSSRKPASAYSPECTPATGTWARAYRPATSGTRGRHRMRPPPGFAAINHECSPNTFMYYNPANGLLNLHALRDIEANEELTSFACPCKCRCCHAVDGANRASEYRRLTLKMLRAELTAHHRAAEEGAPTMDAVRQAISVSRRLVEMLEQEGLFGLEMALCLAEQSRLYEVLGDGDSKERLYRQSLIVRRLCVGAEHPSCMPVS
ncbi:hypothetical protein PG988_008022 [Apiospora saccharicola]